MATVAVQIIGFIKRATAVSGVRKKKVVHLHGFFISQTLQFGAISHLRYILRSE